jgi:hypothetical protein
VFSRQFEAMVYHYKWSPGLKAMHPPVVLQGWPSNVLHGVRKKVMYEETVEALEDRFGDYHLDTAYRSQLKTRNQRVRDSLQEFATTISLPTMLILHYPRTM